MWLTSTHKLIRFFSVTGSKNKEGKSRLQIIANGQILRELEEVFGVIQTLVLKVVDGPAMHVAEGDVVFLGEVGDH